MLFTLPFVLIADLIAGDLGQLLTNPHISIEQEALVAAFWGAVATAMTFRLATDAARSTTIGLVAAFIFAFCSPILSTATRALWQHGPLVVCILATLMLLRAAERRPSAAAWAAIPVALAFITRPLALPLVISIIVFVAFHYRFRLVKFILIGLGIAIAWMAYNCTICVQPVSFYYLPTSFSAMPVPWFDRFSDR